ncbi:uncharacterized protein LOC109433668 [Aedes albopictus]|uniref:UBZ4-type domain-containing protein n=1 Tax=Aedes albopictus TaxID=7160 RepID=A0ABM1YS01_AEDAL
MANYSSQTPSFSQFGRLVNGQSVDSGYNPAMTISTGSSIETPSIHNPMTTAYRVQELEEQMEKQNEILSEQDNIIRNQAAIIKHQQEKIRMFEENPRTATEMETKIGITMNVQPNPQRKPNKAQSIIICPLCNDYIVEFAILREHIEKCIRQFN